jgi:hypothetical protein
MTMMTTQTDIKMTTNSEGFLMEPVSEEGKFFFCKWFGEMVTGVTLLAIGLGDFIARCDDQSLIVRDAAFVK